MLFFSFCSRPFHSLLTVFPEFIFLIKLMTIIISLTKGEQQNKLNEASRLI